MYIDILVTRFHQLTTWTDHILPPRCIQLPFHQKAVILMGIMLLLRHLPWSILILMFFLLLISCPPPLSRFLLFCAGTARLRHAVVASHDVAGIERCRARKTNLVRGWCGPKVTWLPKKGLKESTSHVVDVSCEGYDQFPQELQNR